MPSGPDYAAIDQALLQWRQGDAVLDQVPFFVHVADVRQPLTPASRALADAEPPADGEDGLTGVATNLLGIAVISQTCEILRSCETKPLVEICALTKVTEQELDDVRRLRRPAYGFLPRLSYLYLVANLDMVVSMEKAVLAKLSRVEGCRTDPERRAFADALARKRARFAFPDDFVLAMKRMKQRLKERHGKETSEGATARSIMEIRVLALPGWDAASVTLTFLFILTEDDPSPTSRHNTQVSDWVSRFDSSGRFKLDDEMPWQVCFMEDISAATYTASDRLDLDDLSSRT